VPIPWLGLLDLALGIGNLARGKRSTELEQASGGPGKTPALSGVEGRLAGVMIAALKEVFERDTRRLELEREHMEAERARAERALKLELLRQAAEREIGRLRVVAGVAVAGWLGTLLFWTRLAGASTGLRTAIGAGWMLLLGSLAASFAAQGRISRSLEGDEVDAGPAGAIAPWLLIVALAVIAAAVAVA
jgi:hypothetical protein